MANLSTTAANWWKNKFSPRAERVLAREEEERYKTAWKRNTPALHQQIRHNTINQYARIIAAIAITAIIYLWLDYAHGILTPLLKTPSQGQPPHPVNPAVIIAVISSATFIIWTLIGTIAKLLLPTRADDTESSPTPPTQATKTLAAHD